MTRLALISDQHGNDVAFRAVIEDIERVGVDDIVCLGDVAQGGVQPAATLERLRALGCRTVLGNADDFLLQVPTEEEAAAEPDAERLLRVREWTLEQLGPEHLTFMRSFEPRIDIAVNGVPITCFHGSPRSYEDILLPEHEESSLEPFLDLSGVGLLAGGHTHRQWTRLIGSALFVNPGSIGWPLELGRAEMETPIPASGHYALVVVDRLGLAVEFRRASYDLDDFAAAVNASGHPYADSLLSQWAVQLSAD